MSAFFHAGGSDGYGGDGGYELRRAQDGVALSPVLVLLDYERECIKILLVIELMHAI